MGGIVPLGVLSHSSLSSSFLTSIQLSPVMPSGCLYVAMATFWAMALRGQTNQVRLAYGSQSPGKLWSLPILACKVSSSRLGR